MNATTSQAIVAVAAALGAVSRRRSCEHSLQVTHEE
jgi:hypothetical protein